MSDFTQYLATGGQCPRCNCFPCLCPPVTEMASLVAIKEALKRIEANQANEIAARDLVWQSLGAVERKLEDVVIPVMASLENRLMEAHNLHCSLSTKLDAGLKGVTDGCGQAIADLREWLENNLEGLRLHNQKSLEQVADALNRLASQRKKARRSSRA
jgi:hypothetical protein